MENPWFVSDLDEFLQYCCPECNEKYPSKEPFVLHAFEKHPNAKDCIELRLDSEKVEVICKKQSDQSSPLKFEGIKIEEVVIATDENNILETSQNFKPQMNDSYLNTSGWESEFKPQIVKEEHSVIPDNVVVQDGHVVVKVSQNRNSKGRKVPQKRNTDEHIKCTICQPGKITNETVIYATKDDLRLHMGENIQVHKKFYCELCDKFIFHGLNEHNKKVHGPKTKVECNYCGKYVANKHILKEHIDSVHKGIKLSCPYCKKKIARKRDLRIHINAIHKGIRVDCKICGAKLYKKQSLVNHLKRFHDIEVLERDLQVDQTNQVGTKPIIIKGKAKRQVQVTKSIPKISVKLKNKGEFQDYSH